jgi:UDP-N-acetylmuramoyl-L-alanyl-D-glutamate--2,6-diaminopimelate ligase
MLCLAKYSIAKLLDSAQHLKPVNGRMQIVSHNIVTDPKVIVDYAHTPEAVEKALQALQEYKINKIYCIIGCGGDRDRSKRPLMLQAAVKHSDVVIITQDNPRTEDPQQIINDMLNGAPLHENVIVQMDRATAISQTIAQATEHDLILIAGKGHEDYQIIGTVKVPFSDVLTASLALEARR